MSPSPKSRFCYFLLKAQAMAQLVFGHRTGALTGFDRMLMHWPLDRYALASRAHVLVQLNRLDESISSQQQLVLLAGPQLQRAAAWFNLGYVLQQAGRHEEARPAFEKATEYDPGMDRAWYGLALVLIHQQQFHEAKRALKKNTELQPMSPYGWYRLAEVSLALGEPEKVRQVIEHLRQFEPGVAVQLERDMGLAGSVSGLADKRRTALDRAAAGKVSDAVH